MPKIDRRTAIRAGLAAVSAPSWALGSGTSGVLSFRLIEPAGLRRVAEPIATEIPGFPPRTRFRLFRDGRAIPAQFHPIVANGHELAHALDFAADLGPGETSRYEVHFGPALTPGPEPDSGLSLDPAGDSYRIARGGVPAYEVAQTLRGFLRSAGSPRVPFVSDHSPGLSATLRQGETRTPGQGGNAAVSAIGRTGPLAVGLNFAWANPEFTSNLDLAFPLSRHWVRALWTVHDPGDRVESLGLDLDLLSEPGTCRVEPGPGPSSRWARLEDPRRRSLAVVTDPGRPTDRDRVAITPAGRLSLARRFADPSPLKALSFHLAFDATPTVPDLAASPRAILDPIRVEWDRPAR